MKIQGEHHFQAPREEVWQAVLDPRVLSTCLPGFQRLDSIGNNEYEGALEIKVGPVQGNFQGTLDLSDLKKPSSYRFRLNGMGAAGFVDGEGLLVLEESGDGTKLLYDLDAKVGGRIAGVGQRLLDSSAKVLARQTLEGIDQHFAASAVPAAHAVEETVAAAAPASPAGRIQAAPAPPGQAKFALAFAKGLAGEMVPPAKRPWIIGAGLVVYTIVVILLTRACSG